MDKFPKYPRISRRRFSHWNNDMFIRYNNERVYHHPNPAIRFIENVRVKTLLRFLAVNPADTILAAGCGEGYIEKHLACRKLVMIDISPVAISQAKSQKYPAKSVSFQVADLEKLPFKFSTFDKVECSEVIEHVYSPQNLLRQLARVTKPQGKLVISFPNEPLINSIKKVFIKLRIFHIIFPNVPQDMTTEWHLHSFTLAKFKSLAQKTWQVLAVAPVPSRFLPIRYVILCEKL